MSPLVDTAAPLRVEIDVLLIARVDPDTPQSQLLDGTAMTQTFTLPLPDGGLGRCWIPTHEALAIPCFGRGWVARALEARACRAGHAALAGELRRTPGLRLDAEDVDRASGGVARRPGAFNRARRGRDFAHPGGCDAEAAERSLVAS